LHLHLAVVYNLNIAWEQVWEYVVTRWDRACRLTNLLCQDVAERIVRDAKRRGIRPRLLAMNAYSVQSLPEERLVVFVTSTTGQVSTD
jgi:hypothetical protein